MLTIILFFNWINYHKIIYLLLLYSFFLGCQKKIEKVEESKAVQPRVIITGTSDHPLTLEYLNFISNGYLFGKNYEKTNRSIFNDSIHLEVDSLFEPQSFEFATLVDSTFYSSTIFVEPGDTLSFQIKDKKLRFNGTNAVYNNFFIALEDETTNYSNNPYKGNIYDYKLKTKQIYTQKLHFFKQYIERNNLTTDIYTNLIKDMLHFEYLNNLINPRSVLAKNMNLYYNTQEGVLSAMNTEITNQEQLFDLNDYLDHTTIQDFQRPDLLKNSGAFKNSFDAFIRYYFANNDYLNFSGEAFLAQKDFIQKNFDGELEYYAIARMIREYNVRGFGYSSENIAVLKNTFEEYDSIFSKKPSYKEHMDEIKNSLDNFNFKLSDDALQSKLISIKGDTTTLKEIFSNSKTKIKIIDFWASWCPPCIYEIEKAKTFKSQLSNNDNVEWIYLSIDKDKKSWLKKSKDLKDFLNVQHQYIILGGQNSSLGNALKISGIPRYVIFDKSEKIILDNAPRPSDSLVFKKILQKINSDK